MRTVMDAKKFISGERITGSIPSALILLLYTPIGICLCVLRLFLCLHAAASTILCSRAGRFRSTILRSLYGMCGCIIKYQGKHPSPQGPCMIVANKVSKMDRISLNAVMPNVEINQWQLSPALCYLFDIINMGYEKGTDVLVEKVKKYVTSGPPDKLPLFIQPEGLSTNGCTGLLKFDSWPFDHYNQVLPVCIKVHLPLFGNVHVTVFGASWIADGFWSLFVPCSIYTIHFLPTMQRMEHETPATFSKRLQQTLATAANVEATDISRAAIIRALTPPAVTTPVRRVAPTVSEARVQQIREVLPDVPRDVIVRDLERTRSVDLTLTRLLEGQLAYTPLDLSTNAECAEELPPTTTVATADVNNLDVDKPVPQPPATFSSNPDDRMKTFEERKEALISEARRKYLAKHGKYWNKQ